MSAWKQIRMKDLLILERLVAWVPVGMLAECFFVMLHDELR
jgi:hypothetical protein